MSEGKVEKVVLQGVEGGGDAQLQGLAGIQHDVVRQGDEATMETLATGKRIIWQKILAASI